jgi:hypothetical protein
LIKAGASAVGRTANIGGAVIANASLSYRVVGFIRFNIVETIRAWPFTPLCAPPVAASERLIAELKPP